MKPGDTCIDVLGPDVGDDAQALLDQIDKQRVDRHGWKPLKRISHPAGDPPSALIARLDKLKPSHTSLIGAISRIYNSLAPEGHFAHMVPCARKYVGKGAAVSWLSFEDLPTWAPLTKEQMLAAYLAKALTFEERSLDYPPYVSFLDYLAARPDLEYWIQAARDQVPDVLERELHGGAGIGPDVGGVDRNFEAMSLPKHQRLILVMYSGGRGDGSEYSIQANGLLIVGGPAEFKASDPNFLVGCVYGSMESDEQTPDAFTRFALAGTHTTVMFYDTLMTVPVFRMLTDGYTAAECGAVVDDYWGITNTFGLATLMINPDVLTTRDFLLLANSDPVIKPYWQSKLGNLPEVADVPTSPVPAVPIASGPGPSPGTPPVGVATVPPSAVKIVAARYEKTADSSQFKNVTALVQAHVNAGGDWWVYDEVKPSLEGPDWQNGTFPREDKVLRITYTVNGGPELMKVFGQRDKVVLS